MGWMVSLLAQWKPAPPVLEFPQPELDDPEVYRGYSTRFFKDSEGNTVQVILNQTTGRVMVVWGDAANESMAFTLRDTADHPASFHRAGDQAQVATEKDTRFLKFSLRIPASHLRLGHFLLGSMRVERDFQYFQKHLQPLDSEPFVPRELEQFVAQLERLPAGVRQRHLRLLKAGSMKELRRRLKPQIEPAETDTEWHISVWRPTLDGRNYLSIEIILSKRAADVAVEGNILRLSSRKPAPLEMTLIVGTNSPSLTPLDREHIFNAAFTGFYRRLREAYEKALSEMPTPAPEDVRRRQRYFRRMERQVKSLELLSFQEKLMAGMPNFATYFGRDMMMSALMMEPIWRPEMLEHVIGSVLRKLSPAGEVSHEEALGGQAIRENAVEYVRRMEEYLEATGKGEKDRAAKALHQAEALLADFQAVRENYRMLDDDFQLPVLTARYLTRPDVPADRKRAFLLAPARKGGKDSRLRRLLRNLAYVATQAQPYARQPIPVNLVGFPRRDARHWFSGSWRDSNAGYANGRFAMDINAVWVPNALKAMAQIREVLAQLGYSADRLLELAPEIAETPLAEFLHRPEMLEQAVKTWEGAVGHFLVHLPAEEVRRRIEAKLAWLPEEERTYWKSVLQQSGAEGQEVTFLALSLDEAGEPIPVANTDPATYLFMENFTEKILAGKQDAGEVLRWLRIFVLPYPVGLYLEGVGPAVANDAYASPEVWENFRRDIYHSPRVVWGREVNLLLLGLAKQIRAAHDEQGQLRSPELKPYVEALRRMLQQIREAVERSGLKHNELWSYRIENGRLLPARYATTSDIQLWNLTSLAVEFELNQIEGSLPFECCCY